MPHVRWHTEKSSSAAGGSLLFIAKPEREFAVQNEEYLRLRVLMWLNAGARWQDCFDKGELAIGLSRGRFEGHQSDLEQNLLTLTICANDRFPRHPNFPPS